MLVPVRGMSGLESVVGGRRNGKAPAGEAWFVDGTRSTWMLAMRRYVWLCQRHAVDGWLDWAWRTCHFKQVGLKLGRPLRASSSDEKTYSFARGRVWSGARAGRGSGS